MLAAAAALLAWVHRQPAALEPRSVQIVALPGDGQPDRYELAVRVMLRRHDLSGDSTGQS